MTVKTVFTRHGCHLCDVAVAVLEGMRVELNFKIEKNYIDGDLELEIMDKWLLTKLNKVIKGSTDTFEKYEYSRTKFETEQFFWSVFCDNYLEISKDRLYNPEERGVEPRQSGQYATYETLNAVLKMFAPIMPHVTEEIYQLYFDFSVRNFHLNYF